MSTYEYVLMYKPQYSKIGDVVNLLYNIVGLFAIKRYMLPIILYLRHYLCKVILVIGIQPNRSAICRDKNY